MVLLCRYESPFGRIMMRCDGDALSGLWFEGQERDADTASGTYAGYDTPVFAETRRWLDTYFGGGIPGFIPPLSLHGSPFCMSVWNIMRGIPYGHTATYGGIARELAEQSKTGKTSARAVGGACHRNPVVLIIPCHRVVGADGSLTGYAGGIDRKAELLAFEKRISGQEQ